MEKDDRELELKAVWDLINHLEDRMETLDDLADIQPLTFEQKEEYKELDKTISDLLDRIDDGDD